MKFLLGKLEIEARSKILFASSDTNIDLLNNKTSSKRLIKYVIIMVLIV